MDLEFEAVAMELDVSTVELGTHAMDSNNGQKDRSVTIRIPATIIERSGDGQFASEGCPAPAPLPATPASTVPQDSIQESARAAGEEAQAVVAAARAAEAMAEEAELSMDTQHMLDMQHSLATDTMGQAEEPITKDPETRDAGS